MSTQEDPFNGGEFFIPPKLTDSLRDDIVVRISGSPFIVKMGSEELSIGGEFSPTFGKVDRVLVDIDGVDRDGLPEIGVVIFSIEAQTTISMIEFSLDGNRWSKKSLFADENGISITEQDGTIITIDKDDMFDRKVDKTGAGQITGIFSETSAEPSIVPYFRPTGDEVRELSRLISRTN